MFEQKYESITLPYFFVCHHTDELILYHAEMNYLQMLLLLKTVMLTISYIVCEIEILRQKAPNSSFLESSYREPELYRV